MCSQAVDETGGPELLIELKLWLQTGSSSAFQHQDFLFAICFYQSHPNSQSTRLYFSFSLSTLETKYFVKSIMFRALRDPLKVRPFVFINICDLNYWKQFANRG